MRRFVFIIFFALPSFFYVPVAFATSYSVDIFARVEGCGDGLIQSGEECDTANFGGASCETIGFDEGSLSCSSVCTFITNSCVLDTSSSGGTRITNQVSVPDTNLVIAGIASPKVAVSVLKDGQMVATVPAHEDGSFQITLSGLSSGNYQLQIVATKPGLGIARSEVFPVRVLKNSTTKVSGINLPPSGVLTFENGKYKISGFSIPGSVVSVRQGYAELASVLVSSDGVFIFEFTDSSFPFGKAPITIFSTQANSLIALVGPTLELSVDEATIRTPSGCSLLGDSNDDCRINAVDFFLVRWRYHRELFLERFDFSKDGKVDLIDFSIMAFNWTG